MGKEGRRKQGSVGGRARRGMTEDEFVYAWAISTGSYQPMLVKTRNVVCIRDGRARYCVRDEETRVQPISIVK